jgi:hypothetical protein
MRLLAGQLLLWLAIAALGGGAFRTYHALRGPGILAEAVARVTDGCVVRDGVLVRTEGIPDVVPASYGRAALAALLPGLPELSEAIADSSLVFGDTAQRMGERTARVVLSSDRVVALTQRGVFELARWSDLFGSSGEVPLNHQTLRRYLRARWLYVWVLQSQWALMTVAFKLLSALPFLLIAAFILNSGAGVPTTLRRLALALVPVVAGTVLEAMSGVDAVESRYLLMAAGFVVLARPGRPAAAAAASDDGTGT